MAAPVVESTATTNNATNQTSHTITLPSGIVAGELLLIVFACDGSEDITSLTAGWQGGLSAEAGVSLGIAYKTAAGSDSNPSIGLSSSQMLAAVSFRISGAGVLSSSGLSRQASSTTPACQLIQLQSSDDYLFVACSAHDGTLTISGYPTNYSTNNNHVDNANASGCGVAVATRTLTAASDDPDNFTYTGADNQVTMMLAVAPAAAGGGGGILGAGQLNGGFSI